MAKKKSNRKHNFKHKAPARVEAQVKRSEGPELVEAKPVKQAPKRTGVATLEAEFGPGMSHIKQDVHRVGLLAASFVALELVLWYLFNHTGLGAAVYHLIKL